MQTQQMMIKITLVTLRYYTRRRYENCFPLKLQNFNSFFFSSQKSLDVLGLNQDEILSIFKIIAVVIKLGNLVFVPTTNIDGTEGCNISNEYGKNGANHLRNSIVCFFFFFLTIIFHSIP